MDPNIIQEIVNFLSKWYIWEILIMVLAILFTMFIKIPIKKAAVKWQEKYGIDKSKITWINGMFPYILVFIMVFVLFWYKTGWNMELKDPEFWKDVGTRTAILGSGAIGLYELIKKLKQAVIATHQVNAKVKAEKAKEAGIVEVAIHGDSVVVEEPVKKATKKVAKEEQAEKPEVEKPPVVKPIRH